MHVSGRSSRLEWQRGKFLYLHAAAPVPGCSLAHCVFCHVVHFVLTSTRMLPYGSSGLCGESQPHRPKHQVCLRDAFLYLRIISHTVNGVGFASVSTPPLHVTDHT